eukprot:8117638-Pyramimonas_sp.AAC.1
MRENGDCNGSRGRMRVLRVWYIVQLHQPRHRIHQPPRWPDEEGQGADERMREQNSQRSVCTIRMKDQSRIRHEENGVDTGWAQVGRGRERGTGG